MRMKQCKLFFGLMLICALTVDPLHGNLRKKEFNNITTDNLLIARCRSECNINSRDLVKCENSCLKKRSENSAFRKYGSCPEISTYNVTRNGKSFDICVNQCKHDFYCPGTKKCCQLNCGTSCLEATNVQKIDELAPIPKDVEITNENRNFKTAQIKWDMPMIMVDQSPIFYVIESRSHIGVNFSEQILDNFKLHMPLHYYEERFKNIRRYVGSIKLKPGRWYQFRLASVNHLGTRGFSNYSKPFKLMKKPNPPKPPRNVTIRQWMSNNNSLCYEIKWSTSKSDLPIDRYKLTWSLYSKETNTSLNKEKVFVYEPKYDLKGLLPNSIYYLQIQSICIYGNKHLKSEPESQLINTTIPFNFIHNAAEKIINIQSESSGHHRQQHQHQHHQSDRRNKTKSKDHITVKYYPNSKRNGLSVKVFWHECNEKTILEFCQGARKCLGKSQVQTSVVRKNNYDFNDVQFATQYSVRLKPIGKCKSKSHFVKTFQTPTCENFHKRYPHLNVQCQKEKSTKRTQLN